MACFLADTETTPGQGKPRRLTLASPEIPTGHGRDTSNLSNCKSLILLALPRGLEPLFSP